MNKNIVNSILDNKNISSSFLRQQLMSVDEATADIVSLEIVHEPHGEGLAVIQSDGHEYKYSPDDQNEKFNTVEKLKTAAEKMLRFRSSGAVLGWLAKNALLYAGSKRAEKAATTEEISQKAKDDLGKFLKTIYPEMEDDKIKSSVDSFIKKNNLKKDEDIYNSTKK